MLVGSAFSRRSFRPLDLSGNLVLSARNAELAARQIVADLWGGYLAVLVEPLSHSVRILRDPSSLLPVYRCETAQHVLLTSDITLLRHSPGVNLKVSYDAVYSHLLNPEHRLHPTCLAGVDELVPGILLDPLCPKRCEKRLWTASDFFEIDPPLSFEDAAHELKQLATRVIGAWGKQMGRTCVAASGGVDSSFICGALSRSRTRFDCVTVATPDRSGDESAYAEILAEHLGVRCILRLYDADLFDPAIPASIGLPRPSRRAFVRVLDIVLSEAMDELAAHVIFDGNGGDNLFCFLHSAAPVVDCLREHGITSKSWQTFIDMCRITGCSIPTMLGATIRRLASTSRPDYLKFDHSLLDLRFRPTDAAPLVDWTQDAAVPCHGKQDHLALLLRAQNQIHDLASPHSRFSPLASQPLIEFCLRMPTWYWAAGGRNRALARAAFAETLPANILSRTSKAGPDSFIREAFRRNRPVIRERLLGGLLVAHRLIDLPAVEKAMEVEIFRDVVLVDRLLDLLEAENWARSWSA